MRRHVAITRASAFVGSRVANQRLAHITLLNLALYSQAPFLSLVAEGDRRAGDFQDGGHFSTSVKREKIGIYSQL